MTEGNANSTVKEQENRRGCRDRLPDALEGKTLYMQKGREDFL